MKIIKRGELPQDKIHRETCEKCKSELEFKHSEVHQVSDPREGVLWSIECPVCRHKIWRNGS